MIRLFSSPPLHHQAKLRNSASSTDTVPIFGEHPKTANSVAVMYTDCFSFMLVLPCGHGRGLPRRSVQQNPVVADRFQEPSYETQLIASASLLRASTMLSAVMLFRLPHFASITYITVRCRSTTLQLPCCARSPSPEGVASPWPRASGAQPWVKKAEVLWPEGPLQRNGRTQIEVPFQGTWMG